MPARHHRVTRGDHYRQIVRSGNRVGGAYCITYAVRRSPSDAAAGADRFGYIISKAVGNAVVRNLVRRRMKAITDECIAHGPGGYDVVFRALPRAAEASFQELRREMHASLERARDQK